MRFLLVLLAAAVLVGCGSDDKTSTADSTTTSIVTGASVTTEVPLTPTTVSSSNTTIASQTPPTTTANTTPATGPQVTSISGAPAIFTCSSGPATQGPNTITLSWETANAQSVTVAIDDPNGSFSSGLPTTGSISLSAPCAGNTNTYYVIAIGADGAKDVKSLTTEGRS